jgi:hypothetical protein
MIDWLLTLIVMVPTTVWISLAVHYHASQPWVRYVASFTPIAVVSLALASFPLVPWAFAVWLGLVTITIIWWLSLRPRGDREWAAGMDVMPQAEVCGDTLTVSNFRIFDYTKDGRPIPHYTKQEYELTKLSSIDYFLSHWSGPIMAHTLVSFGFSDGRFLCVSVEARRQAWQKYSPLWGLFRNYELMFVFGDERDIVRLRTNVRREQVYMYRLRMPPDHLRRLLLDYVTRLKRLAAQPEWYNSITSNCTTNLFYQRHAKVPWWLTPRILLNGLSAKAMYQLGYLSTRESFADLQSRCAIRDRAIVADDAADFSLRIREGMDGDARQGAIAATAQPKAI